MSIGKLKKKKTEWGAKNPKNKSEQKKHQNEMNLFIMSVSYFSVEHFTVPIQIFGRTKHSLFSVPMLIFPF